MASWADLIGPAVEQAGGWYARGQALDDDKKRAAAAASDPNFQQAGNLQSQFMSQAAGNPDQMAANRFNAQQGIMAPAYAKSQDDLMRDLYRKGMLGLATSAGAGPDASGQTQTWTLKPGEQANPMMAAFQAAKMADQSKAAYNAMREGQDFQRNAVQNAASLGAQRAQANATARAAQPQINKAAGMGDLFKGIGGMLTNPAVTKALGGLFSGGFGGGSPAGGMPSGQDWGMIEDSIAPISGGFMPMSTPQFGMDDLWGGDLNYGGLSFDWGGGGLGGGLGGDYWSF